jgi:hypothetical protein
VGDVSVTKPEQQGASLPEWAEHTQLLHVYLDGMQYEHGAALVPEGRSGLLSIRLHSSDETTKQLTGPDSKSMARIHVELDLNLTGLHPDAQSEEVIDITDDLTVFRAQLMFCAAYEIAEQSALPPEEERQIFIQKAAVPQLWVQMRQMVDVITSQSKTGRVILPASPTGIQQPE